MTKIIAEIGINHNGSVQLAKELIDISHSAGCDYVKFQKRNPDVCVPEHQKIKPKSTPWGDMTYLDYKKKIEFDLSQYEEINDYCLNRNVKWFSSVWDIDSVEFMKKFKQPDGSIIMKIPSAKITDIELCKIARKSCDILLISTGMSNEKEIEECVSSCNPDVIFHTNSSYPAPVQELNLNYMSHIKEKYDCVVGYSGHEYGLVTTFASVAMGAKWVERHVTVDRRTWGSDQQSSIEPSGLHKLVRGIRDIESAFGAGGPRVLMGCELQKKDSLRN